MQSSLRRAPPHGAGAVVWGVKLHACNEDLVNNGKGALAMRLAPHWICFPRNPSSTRNNVRSPEPRRMQDLTSKNVVPIGSAVQYQRPIREDADVILHRGLSSGYASSRPSDLGRPARQRQTCTFEQGTFVAEKFGGRSAAMTEKNEASPLGRNATGGGFGRDDEPWGRPGAWMGRGV